MRIYLLAMLTLIVTGCTSAVNDSALSTVLDRPMTTHAAALAGDDVALMRRTGRDLIATYDAATGR
ncbi:hypothetical protein JWJ88_17415 [Paracoccus methylovorus]|uniref:Uncharacterized protein n=1 Tax=Paracoccus methylovorus TaxID=2812658 RepID=A0ABX7JM67_9RHOB|nr:MULTISPECIES: hypothetical protein [Paracoccus]QRZ14744.1 hypothetical protein JWJ88_17415 [Paracoccus methylovorus]